MAIVASETYEGGSTGAEVVWFSCTTANSTAQAHTGSGSLLCATTATDGSGVQLNNFPYFAVAASSSYDFSIWYIQTAGTMPTVAWNIHWYDSGGAPISSALVSMPNATSWTQASGTFTSPVGAVTVGWDFQWSVSTVTTPAQTFAIDDLLVADTPTASPPPRGPLIYGQATTQAASY